MTSKARPGTMEVARAGLHFFGGGGGFDGGEEIGIANGFDDRSVQASALRDEAIHGLVGPLHEAVGADGDDGVLHAVEQSFELALAGADGGESSFDLAGGFVDGGGDAADFVEGRSSTRARRSPCSMRAATSTMRSRRRAVQMDAAARDEQGDEESDGGSPKQAAMHLRLHGFDIGERIGEANRAAGDGAAT